MTPEASAGIREWSCKGQWFSLECKIESACHVRCKELASWERMSCKLPIPAGVGTEAVLLLNVWLLEVLRHGRGPSSGLATGTYLQDVSVVRCSSSGQNLCLRHCKEKENKKQKNGCDNSPKAEKAVFQSSSTTKG